MSEYTVSKIINFILEAKFCFYETKRHCLINLLRKKLFYYFLFVYTYLRTRTTNTYKYKKFIYMNL